MPPVSHEKRIPDKPLDGQREGPGILFSQELTAVGF